jgi:hypothetical protein
MPSCAAEITIDEWTPLELRKNLFPPLSNPSSLHRSYVPLNILEGLRFFLFARVDGEDKGVSV